MSGFLADIPNQSPPASPRISMPPKLGLPHSPIHRAGFHSVTHTHAQHRRVVCSSPRARRECIASAFASPLHRDKLSLAAASDTQSV